MSSKICKKVPYMVLLGALLLVPACASTTTSTPPKPAEISTDDTTRTTLAKGKFESPPEIHPSSMSKMVASESGSEQKGNEYTQASSSNGTRISSKEKQVNVRTAPSTKSAVLTVLKSGQAIQVLETRDTWAKISWQQGVTPRNGWIKKAYIEGN